MDENKKNTWNKAKGKENKCGFQMRKLTIFEISFEVPAFCFPLRRLNVGLQSSTCAEQGLRL